MPLLNPSELTVEALMADLPMRRSARNQLILQLMTLTEGLALSQNPLEQNAAIQQHVVSEGETLPIVSLRLYGTVDYWQAIASANELEYPYLIYPGQVLKVPTIDHD